MKTEILSLAKEVGLLVDTLGAEKEGVIQSYVFLIREEKDAKEIVEEVDWSMAPTAVTSAKISVLIDQLIEFGLLKVSSNPGYVLTEKGRKMLLRNISGTLKERYKEYIETISNLGDRNNIVKIAKEKYLEKNKHRYTV